MSDINDDLQIPGENPASEPQPEVKAATKATQKKVTKKEAAPKKPDPEEEVEITLHASDEVPPGGQYVAVNGVGITIPVGQRCKIKRKYLNVLRDASTRVPILDENTLQVIGYRDRTRFSIEVHF